MQELEKAAKVAASELEKANKELVEVRLAAGEGEKSRAAAAALGTELGELKGKFAEVEAGYKKEMTLRKKYYNIIEDMKGKIRVYCRVRPFNKMEREKGSVYATFFPDDMTIDVQTSRDKKSFTFDQCFQSNSTQEAVFEDTQNLIQSAMDGYNVCIFAYGQTGAGKTHTMYFHPFHTMILCNTLRGTATPRCRVLLREQCLSFSDLSERTAARLRRECAAIWWSCTTTGSLIC